MNFINRTASSQAFTKKSEQILGVFTKTKNELINLNSEQQVYINKIDEDLAALKAEREAVDICVKENSNIVKKIEEFLK